MYTVSQLKRTGVEAKTMSRKTLATFISGIYFILLAFLLLAHVYYPKIDHRVKEYLYQSVQKRQAEMTQIMGRGQFWSEGDRATFFEHYK